jgi:hypothetical protein
MNNQLEILRDLNRAKAVFQCRTVSAILLQPNPLAFCNAARGGVGCEGNKGE